MIKITHSWYVWSIIDKSTAEEEKKRYLGASSKEGAISARAPKKALSGEGAISAPAAMKALSRQLS